MVAVAAISPESELTVVACTAEAVADSTEVVVVQGSALGGARLEVRSGRDVEGLLGHDRR